MHREAIVISLDIRDPNILHFDRVITIKLLAANTQQLSRVNSIPGKKPVQRTRGRIPVFTRATHEDMPATPSQDESGVQTGGSRTHNDYVIQLTRVIVHWILSLNPI